MDVIAISDIRDVRDCGGPSEEEPAFIPYSFVVEEVHGCCWSLFTDTQDAMVCLCSPPTQTDSHHDAFVGKNHGRINLLLRRSQDWSFQKTIHFWSHNWNIDCFSHPPLSSGHLFLIVPFPILVMPSTYYTYTPLNFFQLHMLTLDGSCCIYTQYACCIRPGFMFSDRPG